MRIARFTKAGSDPAYGIIELAADGGDNPDTIATLTGDPLAGMKVNYTGERNSLDDVRLLAPVIPRSKIVGVGRNYAEHAAELGNDVPDKPLIFFKPNTTIIGPGDAIVHPAATSNLHFEGELAIVVGRIAKQVPPERVSEVIFGYTIANDVTARDLQDSEDQWARAKGWDTFCPIGPWINTHASIDEAAHWSIATRLGGQLRQQSNTSQMVRSITELVCYISEFTTLLPGDLILTGTPAGVGRMNVGDVVSVEIESLGTLTNPVVAE